MATNDTAALVVALSAQVSRFEKDMQGAVAVADRRTKEIENTFTRLNSTISGKLSTVSQGLSANLGFAGQALTALGPIGIAAAVGIGAAAGAMVFLANAAEQFSIKSKALKDSAETAGLTITQLKLLGSAGKAAGLDFDETAGFFTKYIANLEELRKGGGPLYDALLKIDVGLLRQLAVTKDSATAIDLLISAYSRLTDQTAKLNLARAAGGRAGLSGARLLGSLSEQGGLQGIENNSPKIDESQIERAAKLRTEIDAIKKQTDNIWGSMFSDAILAQEKRSNEYVRDIALWIGKIAGYSKDGLLGADFNSRFAGDGSNPGLTQKEPARITVTPPPIANPSVELPILQKHIALLGDAVTQGEQWRLKRLEIAAAAQNDITVNGVASRALAAFNLTMRAAALATRERLGVANEQQIVDVRLAQLAQDQTKYGLSENEMLQAKVIIMREAKQASEALQVRASYLPGLKQLELDSKNVAKGLDSVLSSGLNTVTDDLAAFVTGTKTAKDAFSDMAKSILNDIVKMSIRQSITGPLAAFLGSSFGGPAGAIQVGTQSFPKFASGTDNAPGGLAWVGENGPELRYIPKGSEITPNELLRGKRGSDGPTVQNTFHVAGEVSQDTVNRLQQMIFKVGNGLQQTNKVITSAQRQQAYGVS